MWAFTKFTRSPDNVHATRGRFCWSGYMHFWQLIFSSDTWRYKFLGVFLFFSTSLQNFEIFKWIFDVWCRTHHVSNCLLYKMNFSNSVFQHWHIFAEVGATFSVTFYKISPPPKIYHPVPSEHTSACSVFAALHWSTLFSLYWVLSSCFLGHSLDFCFSFLFYFELLLEGEWQHNSLDKRIHLYYVVFYMEETPILMSYKSWFPEK